MLLLLSYSFLGLFFVPLVFFYFIFVCRDSASFLHLHVTVLRLFLCSLKVLFQNIWLLFCTFCGHVVSLGLIVSPFGNCFLFLWVDCFILCDYLITCCNHFLPLRVFQRLFCSFLWLVLFLSQSFCVDFFVTVV